MFPVAFGKNVFGAVNFITGVWTVNDRVASVFPRDAVSIGAGPLVLIANS